MISSLANLQAIFHLFSYYPPSGEFCQGSWLVCKPPKWPSSAVTIGEIFICSKIGAKSFKDGSQDICKDIESNLQPVTGSKAEIIKRWAFFNLYMTKGTHWTNWINYWLFALIQFVSCFVLFRSSPRVIFLSKSLKKGSKKMFPSNCQPSGDNNVFFGPKCCFILCLGFLVAMGNSSSLSLLKHLSEESKKF